jgi:anti-sigma factor (TIGR02949 family)
MSGRERDCQRIGARIESYLDGDLDRALSAALESHAAGCPACASELALARQVRAALRSLPRLEAPAPAVHAVLARVRDESGRAGWWWLLPPRPAAIAAAAAIVLLVVLAIAWIVERPPATRVAVEDPAVARATLETKLALAHFADASRRVGRDLGRDLLRERAVLPIARSVGDSLNRSTVERDPGAGGSVPERG